MLQLAPRDVAETILDDLVDLQIAGPTGSSDCISMLSSTAAPDSSPAMGMAMEIDVELGPALEPDLEPALEPEADSEPVSEWDSTSEVDPEPEEESEFQPDPSAEEVEAFGRGVAPTEPPVDDVEHMESASGESSSRADDVAAQPADRPAAPASATPSTCGEAMVLRSLLAECGAIVRWLCDKADARELRAEDIEVARSFLVMAGLPPQNI